MSDDSEDEDHIWDSGPFCRHWCSPPSDCDEACRRCGCRCSAHDYADCSGQKPDGKPCDCEGWEEACDT